MSEMQRLLRVAATRNEAREYTEAKFRVLRPLWESLKSRLREDRISKTVFFEAIVRGYIMQHPAVLAMIEQWVKDNMRDGREKRGPKLNARDLSEIYAAIDSGTMSEED